MSGRRRWLLRTLALGLAVLLWFVAALQKREQTSEKVIEASVTYNTAPHMVILDPVQKVRVHLRGRTSRLRNLNPYAVDVLVSVSETRRGSAEVQLTAEDIVVPEDIEVVSFEPNRMSLQVDREVTQELPVKVKLMGEPAAGAVVQEVRVLPEKALVSGPETRLREARWLLTSNVNLNGHALDFEESAAVVANDPLLKVLQPSVVSVRVTLQPPDGTGPRPPHEAPP